MLNCWLILERIDYLPVDSFELVFTSGKSSTNTSIQCMELDVLNDDNLENNEIFLVRLSSNSDHVVISAGRELAHIVIEEDITDCKF